MISENNVRITAIAIALAKEYDAPWLKGGQTVTRDASGKFSSSSGGGGSSSSRDKDEENLLQKVFSPKRKSVVEKFGDRLNKLKKKVAEVQDLPELVDVLFGKTVNDLRRETGKLLNEVDPRMAAASRRAVDDVFESIEKQDPEKFRKSVDRAVSALEKEYEVQNKKLEKGMSAEEFAETSGRIIGLSTWLSFATISVATHPAFAAVPATTVLVDMVSKMDPKDRERIEQGGDVRDLREAFVEYAVGEAVRAIDAGGEANLEVSEKLFSQLNKQMKKMIDAKSEKNLKRGLKTLQQPSRT